MGFSETRGTDIEPKLAPRTHGFVIQTNSGYRIMRGQIDASPRITEAKTTFEQAKDNLTEATLKLMKIIGKTDMSSMEHMLKDLSQNSEMNTQNIVMEHNQCNQGGSSNESNEILTFQSTEETNEGNEVPNTTSTVTEGETLSGNLTQITQTSEHEETRPHNNENSEQQIQQQETQDITQGGNGVIASINNDNNNNNNNRISPYHSINGIKPRFRQLVTDIAQLDGAAPVRQFKKDVEEFQLKMLAETRVNAKTVETKKFTPPTGFVPKKLSRSQFRRIREAFVRRDGDVREKQYRFLNMMNLIQTEFKDNEKRKTPDVAQIIHRKMCDGNLASALRVANGDMTRERMEITQEDIDTLFPMNENGQWEVMKYTKTIRNITDERIGTLIRRLPRERAPGRSRITYGHIKRLNGNEKSVKQVHDLIKLIYAHPEKVPSEYYTAEVSMIPKANGGKRPIALQESIVKIIHKHIAAVITSHAMGNKDFYNSQFCIGCPEGTAEAAARIYMEMSKDQTCFITSLDLTNAFNTIDQQCIITGLESLNVPEEITEYIYNYLRTYNIHYVCNGYERTRTTHRGVPQGCPAAMALFSVGLYQTLKDTIEKKKIQFICYADDIVMIAESIQDIEEALKEVEHRLTMSQLRLNPEKTKRYTNGDTEGEYKSWRDVQWRHLGIPISPDANFITSCLDEIKNEQLREMEIVWGDKISSHHESYLLQKICIQPKSQYSLRAIMATIPKEYLEEWDKEIEKRYPGYIQRIPTEYRMQQIPEGGLQLMPPSVVRMAASTAFKASNNIEKLDETVKKCIQETTGQEEDENLQHTITRFIQWYSKEVRRGIEKNIKEGDIRKRKYEQPDKMIGDGDNSLVEGRPTVMVPQDSAWLSRLPNKPGDILDYTSFKIAITMRYNLKWEADEELNKLFCANHKKAYKPDSQKELGCRLSLSHAIGCKINAEGRIGLRHDTIVRVIGRSIGHRGINPSIEQPLYYEENGERKECQHRPDIWYAEDSHINVFDVTVGAFKNKYNREDWVFTRKRKEGQYRDITRNLKENMTLSIIQFDVAGRVGPDTERVLENIGVRRRLITDIQLMILSLNGWLYRNALSKAIAERNDGHGMEALVWADRLLGDC